MEYKLIKKDAFKVIGKAIKMSTKDGENFKQIPKFWEKSGTDGTIKKICSCGNDNRLLGAYLDFDYVNEECNYMIAIEHDNNIDYDEFETREIIATTWAVFTSVGPIPQAIQNTMKKAYENWFPTSGFQHADAPAIEVYFNGDFSSNDYKCELWIPLIEE